MTWKCMSLMLLLCFTNFCSRFSHLPTNSKPLFKFFPKYYSNFIPIATLLPTVMCFTERWFQPPALRVNPDGLLPVICPGLVTCHNAGQWDMRGIWEAGCLGKVSLLVRAKGSVTDALFLLLDIALSGVTTGAVAVTLWPWGWVWGHGRQTKDGRVA